MTDYYAILEISRAAQADDIAKAYRRAALTYNPSINHTDLTADEGEEGAAADQYQPLKPQQQQEYTSMVKKALTMGGGSAVNSSSGNNNATMNLTTSTLTPQEKQRRFKLVSQAYTVLSEPQMRAVYDAYGEDGVRHGGTGTIGIAGGLSLDEINPDHTFRTFFGVDTPFQVLGNRNILSAEKGQVTGGTNTRHHFFSESAAENKNPPPAPPVRTELSVTLEDIHQGAVRRLRWTNKHIVKRSNFNPTTKAADGTSAVATTTSSTSTGATEGNSGNVFNSTATMVVSETPAAFELPIPVGVKDGSVLTLKGKGNTQEGCVQGDVLVTVRTMQHDRFRRGGGDTKAADESGQHDHDLHITVPISLADSLSGTKATVKTIDGRELDVLIDEVVHPSFKKVIVGEGLRVGDAADAGRRGDLVIECAVAFPQYLTAAQKEEIRRVLK